MSPMEEKIVVVQAEDDVTWSPILPELVRHLRKSYRDISILNITAFSFPRFRRPPAWVSARYHLNSGNDSLQGASPAQTISSLDHRRKIPSELKIEASDLKAIDKSVDSLMMSLFADYKPWRHLLLYPILRREAAGRAYDLHLQVLTKFFEMSDLIVFIPNGRFPHQKAVELAARRSGASVRFYERGFRPDRGFYLGSHPTQDRISRQSKATELSRAKLSSNEMAQASEWIQARRQPNSIVNEFSSSWSGSLPSEVVDKNFSTVFFTSSQDEFLALENWAGFGWVDQYQAFEAFTVHSPGPKCLRIHPNFINKSFGHALDEIRRVLWLCRRSRDLVVVWPRDPVSSYDLIDQAEKVFVHGSTVGLEASAVSKSVWNSGNSIYDLHADIRNFKPHVNYGAEYFEPWNVDPQSSLEIVKVMLEADVPFSEGVRAPSWNSTSVPLVIRILNLLRARPIQYLFILLQRRLSVLANMLLIFAAKKMIANARRS